MQKIAWIIATLAACSLGRAQSTTDAWDVSSGTTVLAHSALDDSAPASIVYDVRDMFGTRNTSLPERGNVVFQDASGNAGYVDFVEWRSISALAIKSYTLYWNDDFPDHNWRNLSRFGLYGKKSAGDPWSLLDSRSTPLQVGAGSISGSLAGVAYQFWRAEFTRGASSDPASDGPRIVELDGFVAPVPEPASFAALGLGALGFLRRRRA